MLNIPLEIEMPLTLANNDFRENMSVNMKNAQIHEYFNIDSELFPVMKKKFKKIIDNFNILQKKLFLIKKRKKIY